jgi:hypothetical protein
MYFGSINRSVRFPIDAQAEWMLGAWPWCSRLACMHTPCIEAALHACASSSSRSSVASLVDMVCRGVPLVVVAKARAHASCLFLVYMQAACTFAAPAGKDTAPILLYTPPAASYTHSDTLCRFSLSLSVSPSKAATFCAPHPSLSLSLTHTHTRTHSLAC